VTYQEALDFLYPLHRFGIKPGLERVYALLETLGSPQQRLGDVVHIAGTNGKGTVAAACASIFQASGRKTALFTSPHLVDFTERIRINGEQIPHERVVHYCSRIRQAVIDNHATFFEATTVIAFAWFADEGVDASIIETGMGGRLDATNVVQPTYVVIPSIGFDHTEWLGNTLARIAIEKAGIIKKGCKVFTAVSDPEALEPIQQMSVLCQVPLALAQNDVQCGLSAEAPGQMSLNIRTALGYYPALQVPLTGTFHAQNISLAVMVAEAAGIAPQYIAIGLERLLETGYRGRLEVLRLSPIILIDVSHNAAGMRVTVDTLASFRHRYHRVVVMLGLASDKDAEAIIQELLRLRCSFVMVDIPSERSVPASSLTVLCKDLGGNAAVCDNPRKGLAALQAQAGVDDLILVTGSFYLAGNILADGW